VLVATATSLEGWRPQNHGPSPFEARRKGGSHLRVTDQELV
jgi:hypothetical protein